MPIRAPDTRSAQPPATAAAGELGRVRLELEAEPRPVARDPPQPRRVVAEARVVQDAQPPRGEIVERVLDRAQLAAGRSSASALTVTSRRSRSSAIAAGADVGQRPRVQVALGARRGEVPAALARCSP